MGRFETVRMVKPEIRPTDTYIFSREGDRFDQLAQEFYNDVTLWWFIAVANDLRAASLIIPPGLQIRIPDPVAINFLGLELNQAELDK